MAAALNVSIVVSSKDAEIGDQLKKMMDESADEMKTIFPNKPYLNVLLETANDMVVRETDDAAGMRKEETGEEDVDMKRIKNAYNNRVLTFYVLSEDEESKKEMVRLMSSSKSKRKRRDEQKSSKSGECGRMVLLLTSHSVNVPSEIEEMSSEGMILYIEKNTHSGNAKEQQQQQQSVFSGGIFEHNVKKLLHQEIGRFKDV